MNEWLLLNPNRAMFLLYHRERELFFDEGYGYGV